MKIYIILQLFIFGILSCETDPEVELLNDPEVKAADDPEVKLSCGPYAPYNNAFPSDDESIDTTFFYYQEGLNLELTKCFDHTSYPGYSLTDGNKMVFMFYFHSQPKSGPDDAMYTQRLIFETPADIDSFYIKNVDFCDHKVYYKGYAPFVINNELVDGPGCIYIKKVEEFTRTSEDVYEVNLNLPVKGYYDSTFQFQFTEMFTKTELLD